MQDRKQTRTTTNNTLIQFGRHISQPLIRRLTRLAFRPLVRMMAVDAINAWCDDLVNAELQGTPFSTILGVRDISYRVAADDLAKIPDSGPLVVVANHPFGGLEGIVLGDLLRRVRRDTKILGNYLLEKIEPIRDSIIPIDPFGRQSSVSPNAKTLVESVSANPIAWPCCGRESAPTWFGTSSTASFSARLASATATIACPNTSWFNSSGDAAPSRNSPPT